MSGEGGENKMSRREREERKDRRKGCENWGKVEKKKKGMWDKLALRLYHSDIRFAQPLNNRCRPLRKINALITAEVCFFSFRNKRVETGAPDEERAIAGPCDWLYCRKKDFCVS